MKVLITGDHNWDDYARILRELETLPENTIIVHGACKGADIIAGELAKELGFTVREYPAAWSEYGRPAGPIRNRSMFKAEHLPEEPIDLCLAFHNDILNSRGTRDMINVVKSANVLYKLCTSHD